MMKQFDKHAKRQRR